MLIGPSGGVGLAVIVCQEQLLKEADGAAHVNIVVIGAGYRQNMLPEFVHLTSFDQFSLFALYKRQSMKDSQRP